MTTFAYIAIIIVAIILIVATLRMLTKKPKQKKEDSAAYTTALNFLIMGKRKEALEKLREAVRLNTSNIDAYIKIGDILREEGMIDRATKIHRGLTVRRDLKPAHKNEILRSLIKDYRASQKYDRAIAVCKKLLELTNSEILAQETLLMLYEDSKDWDNAVDVAKKIQKEKGEKNGKMLALYCVEAGLVCVEKGKERDGRIKYREAIKLDKTCPSAYLNLADSYIREERLDDALVELQRFIRNSPKYSYLGFQRMKDVLFKIGNFGEIENIFQTLLKENPDNEDIRFSLSEIYEKKGDVQRALKLCERELDRNPESKQAKRYLAVYTARLGKKDKALNMALELLETLLDKKEDNFVCKSCGYISREPKWHCPQCSAWDSFIS
ncbi:MAG: tetratricopeptide repeat protein [Candidatus Zhuqueibacterota bacterium]